MQHTVLEIAGKGGRGEALKKRQNKRVHGKGVWFSDVFLKNCDVLYFSIAL